MPQKVSETGMIDLGEYFESCSFHPCLCIEIDDTGRNIEGISLVDGSIQSCSVIHCGLRKLTFAEAVHWKKEGPQEIGDIEIDNKWW